jgi:hypothetical protein
MKTDAECNRCHRSEVQCTCRPRSSAKRRVRSSVGRRARQSAAVSREDDREGSQRVIEPVGKSNGIRHTEHCQMEEVAGE